MKRKQTTHKKTSRYFIRFFVSIVAVLCIVVIGSQFIPSPSLVCANSITCAKDLSVRVQNNAVATFEGKKILVPQINLAHDTTSSTVLGLSTPSGEKHIYVDLSTQTLSAYQGKTLVLKTLISSGKWHPTPDGTFTIWVKLRATRMSGGSGDDYYDLPNVPYVMFFSNDDVSKAAGFSLHGAYWHNNFGHAMSHGCVNMRIADAKALYDWVDPPTDGLTTYTTTQHPGTQVTIVGEPPTK